MAGIQGSYDDLFGAVPRASAGMLDSGDAPVGRYWPEFAATGKEKVLVRHLLSHAVPPPVLRRGPLGERVRQRPSVPAFDGAVSGVRLLSAAGCAPAWKEQFAVEDRGLGTCQSGAGWAAACSAAPSGGATGGSLVVIDPEGRMAVAYVTDQMRDPADDTPATEPSALGASLIRHGQGVGADFPAVQGSSAVAARVVSRAPSPANPCPTHSDSKLR
ncbi:hypothetical protein ACRAWF_41105 [Streptomyces sp. L7]